MRKRLKLMGVSTASTLALAASLAMPLSTFALTGETSLVNSGDDATINSAVNQTSILTIANTNTAETHQMVNASSNTGDNEVEGNIGGGGSIVTGAALTQAALGVEGNTNVVGVAMPMAQGWGGQSVDVVNTGDDATINSSWNELKQVTVANTNTANTHQMFFGSSNTGDNEVEENIGATGIQTGAAATSAVMGVEVNKNTTTVNGMGGALGLMGSTANLTNTGDDVTLNTAWNSTNVLTVANSNAAQTMQMMHANANSGDNESEDNIGAGIIMTGPATATGQMHVDVNSNMTGIAGWGGLILGTLADLVNTGDDLIANNVLNNTFVGTVANNNMMVQHQSLMFHSNSGDNESEENIGGTGATLTSGAAAGGTAHVDGNSNATVFGSFADVLLFLALGA
jgi:hypothetical protein